METILNELIAKYVHGKYLDVNAKIPNYVDDLKDKTYNGITVIKFLGTYNSHAIWFVKCTKCNSYHIMFSYSIVNREKENVHRCDRCKNIKHNDSKTTFYRQWYRINRKCYNVNDIAYPYFGEKGITVCERWKTYGLFKEDLFKSYSEDNILKLKPGCKVFGPDNVYWK